MPKTKSKKGGQKKKGGKKAPSKGGALTPAQKLTRSIPKLMQFGMQTCAVTNPFCPEATGAKWPDGSYTKSVPWDILGLPLSVAALASGSTAIVFVGDLAYNTVGAASMSGTTATMNANFSTIVTPPTGVVRTRLTSWGLKVNVNTSSMTTQGSLRVRLFSPLTGSTLGAIDCATTLADASFDVPLSRLIGDDFHIIPMPISDEARQFKVPTSSATVSSWSNPGWQVVCIGVTGTTASLAEAIVVTAYYHFELVMADGDATNAFSRAPPPKSDALMANSTSTLQSIGNFVEGAATKVDAIFKSKAMKLAASAVATAYYGPAAGGQVYGLADRGQAMLMN